MSKTVVLYHSADFDGLFCREIARKFLPDAVLIGWDYGDPTPAKELLDGTERLYMLDISIPDLMDHPKLIWIDHHKSAMEKYHPMNGTRWQGDRHAYCIDGVAACRLAWQWFRRECQDYPLNAGPGNRQLPTKEDFTERRVVEPVAVRLAGEYDIWSKHWMKEDPRVELFQHGLRSCPLDRWWPSLLSTDSYGVQVVNELLDAAKIIQYVRDQEYAEVIKQQGFGVEFEGVKFLACNSHELDIRSHLFAAGIEPHHEALLGFTYTGHAKGWRVSMYHIEGKEHIDILSIAKKFYGGGHAGACGFRVKELPFSLC